MAAAFAAVLAEPGHLLCTACWCSAYVDCCLSVCCCLLLVAAARLSLHSG